MGRQVISRKAYKGEIVYMITCIGRMSLDRKEFQPRLNEQEIVHTNHGWMQKDTMYKYYGEDYYNYSLKRNLNTIKKVTKESRGYDRLVFIIHKYQGDDCKSIYIMCNGVRKKVKDPGLLFNFNK